MSRKLIDSGIEWIGRLPEKWGITTVNRIFYRRKEVNTDSDPVILSLARDGIKIRDISTNEGQLAESYDNYHKVYKDDLMINPMDLISGANCSLSEVEGVISPAYINLAKKQKIYPKYYDYFFKYQYWVKAMFIHGKGVSFDNRWTMNWETLANYKVPLMSYDEQKRIADFLDGKCSKIDEIINDNNKEIELLDEYKKSVINNISIKGFGDTKKTDIKYLNEVMIDSVITKVEFILKNRTEKNHPNAQVLSLYREYGVVPKDSRDDNYNVTSENTENYKYVEKGDLVVNKMKAWQGSLAVSEYDGIVSPAYYVCSFKKEMNKKYFHYLIRSKNYSQEFERLSIGIRPGQWDLSNDNFMSTYVAIPNIKTQDRIVSYLDDRCAKIDEVIDYRRQIIEKLEEYKRSLIYECVTGKREV